MQPAVDPPEAPRNDDVTLLRAYQRGEESAYERLVLRYHAFVVRHARRYVGDPQSADDVAQEVFLRLYRCADQFRSGNNFRGWLATITTRLALNELRTRRRKRWVPRSTLDGEEGLAEWRPGDPDAAEGPPEALLRQERIDLVRAAMARLPDRQQLALWLQRFEGWDLEQVGAALELSLPAVKSLLHRARAALLEELESTLKPSSDTPTMPFPSERRP